MGISELSRKIIPCKSCGAVIVAAGSARRMGGVDKIMADLGGEPLIAHTIRSFQAAPVVKEIVVVTRQDLILPIADLCKKAGFTKVTQVVVGGDNRVDSVNRGLSNLSDGMELAAVADGARPLVTPTLIDRVVRAAHSFGAAAPALEVKDTIKEIETDGFVANTPNRATLRAVQTPQVFDYDMLRGALTKAIAEEAPITDDCSAVERLGMRVKLVQGDERNFKVTTQLDLLLARELLREEQA